MTTPPAEHPSAEHTSAENPSSENPSSENPGRRYVLMAIKIAVSIILLTILFSRIDTARLWQTARQASARWLVIALGVYFFNVLVSVWRWKVLLNAQQIDLPSRTLLGSFLVAQFFNNFLPSNIGGDVIRIRDTAKAAKSKTLATTIILIDRFIGLTSLVLVAASGATMVGGLAGHVPSPIWPTWLWVGFLAAMVVSAPAVLAPAGVGRLLQPLTVLHPEWVGDRIDNVTRTLSRFRERPAAIFSCFGGAIVVQASIVVFYVAVALALHVRVTSWDLAVIVPLSLLVQMLPISVNGFGVREATFSLYFSRIGLPLESGLLISLVAAVVIMVFSVSGVAVWFARGHQ